MGKKVKNNNTECRECTLSSQERLNYFTGQFLAERDFRAEQGYHIGKGLQHNRYLHGWGTVCGLRVKQHPTPECRNRIIIIEPGLALDCCGREIVVPEEMSVPITKYLIPAESGEAGLSSTPQDLKKGKKLAAHANVELGCGKVVKGSHMVSGNNTLAESSGKHLLLSLCYNECKTEYVPSLYSECGCVENQCEANRVHEGFEVSVQLVDQLPEEVKEQDCKKIFWQSLEGCPECGDDVCVPLAVVYNYKDNQSINDTDIDNRIRPLVPSTETLRQAILCALENGGGSGGTQGDPGTPGSKWLDGKGKPNPGDGAENDYYLDTDSGDVYKKTGNQWGIPVGNIKGKKGDTGDPGTADPCLEKDLTRIVALSWTHNDEYKGGNIGGLLDIYDKNQKEVVGRGIVIGFGKKLRDQAAFDCSKIAANKHVFQVLADRNPKTSEADGIICRCAVDGWIFPVNFKIDDSNPKLVSEAWVSDTNEAPGVAFLFTYAEEKKPVWNAIQEQIIKELFVQLRGDFVIDKDGRAIDAEFVRGELPTGDRKTGGEYGIQGGLFESWFTINKE
jgi:hypothetical protein